MNGYTHFRSYTRLLLCTLAAAAVMASAGGARAQLVVSVQSVAAAAGSTGNTFDVTLTNSGASAVTIGGFFFEVSLPSTDITFTGVTTATSTSTYIFDGNSLFGPNIDTSNTGQDIQASDLAAIGGTTIGGGVTVGLGHVAFDVSNSASGSYAVTLAPWPATSLADANGADVTIDSLNNGAIRVTGGGAVPEPGVLALLTGLAIPGVLVLRRRG